MLQHTFFLKCIENLYFWAEFSIVFFCMYYSKMVIGYCLLIRLVFTLTISVSRSQRLRDLTPFALVENVFCKLPTVVCAFSPLYKLAKKVGQKGKMQLQTKEWNSIPFWNTFGARFSSIIIIKRYVQQPRFFNDCVYAESNALLWIRSTFRFLSRLS